MKAILQYAWLTIKHKYFVFVAGRRLGVSTWRLLKHDWTKLMPSELPHYGRQFFGDQSDPFGFIRCWTRHQNRHEHHWEYWIPRTGHNRCEPPFPPNVPIPMLEQAVREMVADWIGASRAYEGKWPTRRVKWVWLRQNFAKINLHRDTKELVDQLLDEVLDA